MLQGKTSAPLGSADTAHPGLWPDAPQAEVTQDMAAGQGRGQLKRKDHPVRLSDMDGTPMCHGQSWGLRRL